LARSLSFLKNIPGLSCRKAGTGLRRLRPL
jgi:hypothetical protein